MNMRKIVVILLICALVLGCAGVVSAEEVTRTSSAGGQEDDNTDGQGGGNTENQEDDNTDGQGGGNTENQEDDNADGQGGGNTENQEDDNADGQGGGNTENQEDDNTDGQGGGNTGNNTTTPIPKKDLEASISANVTKGSVPLAVNFTAEVDDSLIAEYKWEVHEDENYMYGRSVEYTYKEAGEYTVTLTLTPKDTTTYFKTKITKTITVTQEKLEAIISASEDEGVAPLKITFTGTAKGNPVSWEWDFDDGSSLIKNQTKVEHSFTKAGVYNVRLTIRNETGSTASTTKQIEVTEKPTTTTTTATPTKTTAPTTAATTVQAVKSASISADDHPIPNPLDIIEELIRLLKVMLVPENYSLA